MKNILLFFLLTQITVMSYNIRVSNASDGENDWELRKAASVEMVLDQKPDICGLQEALENQVLYMQKGCKGYEMVGVGHDVGATKGEHMSFLYRKSRLKLLKWGTFWLSETPEKQSLGWDGAYQRTATWALMKERRSGKMFFFVNTHLDHVGKVARAKGLELILEKIAELNPEGYPLIVEGDMNTTIADPAFNGFKGIMSNARETAKITTDEGSYNGWGEADGLIDFIWYNKFSNCASFEVVKKEYGRKYVSDHYPVQTVLEF